MRQYPNHRLLSLPLLALGLVLSLALTTACSEKNDNEEPDTPDTPVTPETPTNPDDWQTVPASGGTVSRGDITITFPSGTFTAETKVAVTEVEKSSIRGEDEVSTFYQVTMPVTTNKPVTVSVKSSVKDDNVILVAHSQATSLHEFAVSYVDVPLEATYANGEYTAEIPAFDNGDDGSTATIALGLTRSASAPTSSQAPATKAQTRAGNESDGNISYSFDWGSYKTAQENVSLQMDIQEDLDAAVAIIKGLGFKVKGDRTIPILVLDESDLGAGEYGRFQQSWMSDEWSSIKLNKALITSAGFSRNELRQTVCHEMFHYFQSDYDKRCALTKGAFDGNAEFLIIYEAGGAWIERLAGDHSYSKLIISDGNALFEGFELQIPEKVETLEARAKSKGYGMALVLEWLSKKKGDKSILTLYEHWRDKDIKNTTQWIKDWGKTYGYDFFDDDNFRDFVEDAANGKIVKGFNFYWMPGLGGSVPVNDENSQYKEIDLRKHGARKQEYQLKGWTRPDGSSDTKNCKLTISQKDTGVYGLVFICSFERYQDADGTPQQRPVNEQFLGYFNSDQPLVITDEAILKKLISKNPLTYLYTVTSLYFNNEERTSKQTVQLSIDKLELTPDSLAFDASESSKAVTVETNVDDITVTPSDNSWLTARYVKSNKTIEVTAKANTGGQRTGIITVAAKSGNTTMEKTIKVTQAAAKGEFDFTQLKAIRVEIDNMKVSHVKMRNGNYTTTEESYSHSFWKNRMGYWNEYPYWNVSVSQSGQGAHIDATWHQDDNSNRYIYDYAISIDIDDVVSGHITNCSVTYTSNGGIPQTTYKENISFSASNLPLPNSSGYVTGRSSTGSSLNSFTDHQEFLDTEHPYSDTYTAVGSNDWEVSIRFYK